MLIELSGTLAVFSIVLFFIILIDGLFSGYSFIELRKIYKYIIILGYVAIAIYFVCQGSIDVKEKLNIHTWYEN